MKKLSVKVTQVLIYSVILQKPFCGKKQQEKGLNKIFGNRLKPYCHVKKN
jgi:hypothetical protein